MKLIVQMSTLVAVVLLITFVTGDQTGNANEYLDQILEEARNSFQDFNLDPLTLPDVTTRFEKKVLFVKLYGGFEIREGLLYGLTSLHRAGDATLDQTDEELIIRATLAVNRMNVGSKARAYFGKLNIPWSMACTIDYIKATIELRVPTEDDFGMKPRATALTIHKIGKVTANFKDLGPLNWVLNGMGYAVGNVFKNTLRNRISQSILGAINQCISRSPNLYTSIMQ